MEIPIQAYGSTVTVGKLYFFKTGCPIGVENHIHVCVFRDNRIFLFATGSSQLDKAKKRAAFFHYNPKSYPVFSKDKVNKFDKDTYVDCNKPIETSPEVFCELLNQRLIFEMEGFIDTNGIKMIAEGIKSSTLVEERIKKLF